MSESLEIRSFTCLWVSTVICALPNDPFQVQVETYYTQNSFEDKLGTKWDY